MPGAVSLAALPGAALGNRGSAGWTPFSARKQPSVRSVVSPWPTAACPAFLAGRPQRTLLPIPSTADRASAQVASSSLPEAVLFDCDGVLVDTERDGHRIAFNEAFKQKGTPTLVLHFADRDQQHKRRHWFLLLKMLGTALQP